MLKTEISFSSGEQQPPYIPLLRGTLKFSPLLRELNALLSKGKLPVLSPLKT